MIRPYYDIIIVRSFLFYRDLKGGKDMANNSAQFNLGIKTSADLSGVNQIKKALDEVRKIASEGSGFFDVNEIKQMTSAANTLERALNGAFDVRLNTVNIAKFNDILKQSNTSITEIQNGLSYAGAAGQKAFLGMTSQLFKVNSVMKQSNTFLTNLANLTFLLLLLSNNQTNFFSL